MSYLKSHNTPPKVWLAHTNMFADAPTLPTGMDVPHEMAHHQWTEMSDPDFHPRGDCQNTGSSNVPDDQATDDANVDNNNQQQPPPEYSVNHSTATAITPELHRNHHNSRRSYTQQTIVDTNDLMMIHNHSNKIYHHRYVLADDEVEPSLQELDDTVASLDGNTCKQHHRRTHTANSSSLPSNSGHTAASTGCGENDTSSLMSRTCSVLTEKSHAVMMHRHLIDNMESIGYHSHYQNRSSTSYKMRSKNRKITSGSKSISSRNSSTSRRSTAQQSLTSHRTTTTTRRPRGPSLERAIFQTLLHTARSDVEGAHFITTTLLPTALNDTHTDEAEERVNMSTQKEEEDSNIELILKDLIQADAVLAVEVGAGSSRSLDHILVHEKEEIEPEGANVAEDRSVAHGRKQQPLLLPPIATEEEPESLLPTPTSPVQMIATDHHHNILSEMEEGEWEPDFDAIDFPTAPCAARLDETQHETIRSSFLHQSPDKSTATTISHNREPHSSNEDSPESDLFDQIDDDDGYVHYHDDELGIKSFAFHDEQEEMHASPATDRINLPVSMNQPQKLVTTVPIVQPRVTRYNSTNCTNTLYYEIDAIHEEIASWGFDDMAPIEGKSTEVMADNPPTTTATQPSDNHMHDDTIFFPTILQEEGYKSSTANATTVQPPLQHASGCDEWTSFDVNPFASDHDRHRLSSSDQNVGSDQPQSAQQTQHQPHRVHEVLSDATSQDNVSVSSPSSVVQFQQIVDRCPSNKSDKSNNPMRPFDTKCSF